MPVPLVRQAALTTTKVPWFNGSTSWEQYQQVFDAIVLSNGWGDATAALQLLWGETDTSEIPVYKECCTLERRRPVKVSPDAHAQVVISDNQWNSRDCCFGVFKKADSVNQSGTGSCWDCLCWLVWGYRVSCLAVIVIKD